MNKFLTFLILSVLLLTIFTACPDPVDPPINTPEPIISELQNDIKFGLIDDNSLLLWDGENIIDIHTGHVKRAGKRKFSLDDSLYYFDEKGNSVYSAYLNIIPDAITTRDKDKSGRAEIVYTDDVFTIETIDPLEAAALGAIPRYYTRIYENAIEVGTWYDHEWETDYVITSGSGHIIAIDTWGSYHNLTNGKIIDIAHEDSIMLHDMGTEHGYISDSTGTYEITWIGNHFDHSVWQFANNEWYTENGYTWSPQSGVISNANSMYVWNSVATYPESYSSNSVYGENPYILPVGVRNEAGIDITYWLETVTGQLYRYSYAGDTFDVAYELYEGPGTRIGAIPYYNTLNPVLVDDELYFNEDGFLKYINLETGIIEVFSEEMEIIPW